MKVFRLRSFLHRALLVGAACLLLTSAAAAFDTTQDSGLLLLVSKSHTISGSYIPTTVALENINSTSNGMLMREETAAAFTRMYSDMAKDGITLCNVISAYRSYDYQKYLVDSKVEKRVANGQSYQYAYEQVTLSTAPAGASEHQLGLALDLSASTYSSQSFADTAAGKWMAQHAWKYGFIRRYDGSKAALTGIVNEAWHYRYVGIPHAQIMVEQGWCFEEYIAYLHENGSYTITEGETTYTVYWTQDETAEFSDVVDLSRDNDGGWIITTSTAADPFSNIQGHWSESAFTALAERGINFINVIAPNKAISKGSFARLCGIESDINSPKTLTRQDTARFLEPYLSDKTMAYLTYSDLDKISGSAFQSIQIAVSNGIFSHVEGAAFRPTDKMTWAEAAVTALRYLERLDQLEADLAEPETSGDEVAPTEDTETDEAPETPTDEAPEAEEKPRKRV